MIPIDTVSAPPRGAGAQKPSPDDTLRAAAKALETTFLAEMLKSAGLDGIEGSFSGGIGESQFTSFQRQEQARALVDAGGIGLAEQIFRSLKENAS